MKTSAFPIGMQTNIFQYSWSLQATFAEVSCFSIRILHSILKNSVVICLFAQNVSRILGAADFRYKNRQHSTNLTSYFLSNSPEFWMVELQLEKQMVISNMKIIFLLYSYFWTQCAAVMAQFLFSKTPPHLWIYVPLKS